MITTVLFVAGALVTVTVAAALVTDRVMVRVTLLGANTLCSVTVTVDRTTLVNVAGLSVSATVIAIDAANSTALIVRVRCHLRGVLKVSTWVGASCRITWVRLSDATQKALASASALVRLAVVRTS